MSDQLVETLKRCFETSKVKNHDSDRVRIYGLSNRDETMVKIEKIIPYTHWNDIAVQYDNIYFLDIEKFNQFFESGEPIISPPFKFSDFRTLTTEFGRSNVKIKNNHITITTYSFSKLVPTSERSIGNFIIIEDGSINVGFDIISIIVDCITQKFPYAVSSHVYTTLYLLNYLNNDNGLECTYGATNYIKVTNIGNLVQVNQKLIIPIQLDPSNNIVNWFEVYMGEWHRYVTDPITRVQIDPIFQQLCFIPVISNLIKDYIAIENPAPHLLKYL